MERIATPARRHEAAAPTALRIAVVGLLYWATALLGAEISIGEQYSPVWIPAGVALVAVLRWGPWMSVGVFVGEVGVALQHGAATSVALTVGIGNAVEPLVAVMVLRRLGVDVAVRRVRDVFALLLAIAIGAAISATISVTAFYAVDAFASGDLLRQWILFWSSVVLGVVLIAPIALAILDERHAVLGSSPLRLAELAALALIVTATSAWVLDGHHAYATVLLFPLFVWAALRFGVVGASGSILLATVVSVSFQLRDQTILPELGLDQIESVLAVQAILATAAIGNLSLATLLRERDTSRIETLRTATALAEAQAIAHIGSWTWHLNGGEIEVSDELARIFDLPRASTTIDDLLGRVPHDDRIELEQAITRAIDDGGAFAIEHRVHEGSDERMVLHAGRVAGRARSNRRLVATALDITERTSIDRLRDALIATASHELRTPLTSIVGFSDTLVEHWDRFDEARRLEFLRIIRTQGRRLSTIVDDTLMQSRLDTGSLVTSDEPYPVLNAITDALMIARMGDVDVDVDSSLVAVGSQEHLTQILVNFLTNARKYGEPPVAVHVEPIDGGTHLDVQVIDHGPGIDPAFRERLFERFTRGPGTDAQPGTGLGLSIVRGLAETNGGTVRYERHGERTVFAVTVRRFTHDRTRR